MIDRRYMVKQFVGEVHGLTPWGSPVDFRVFETGDAKFWLFDRLDPAGCSLCEALPYAKASLRKELRRALNHGQTFTSAARNRYESARLGAAVGSGDGVAGD
jgi:hypothetical protein